MSFILEGRYSAPPFFPPDVTFDDRCHNEPKHICQRYIHSDRYSDSKCCILNRQRNGGNWKSNFSFVVSMNVQYMGPKKLEGQLFLCHIHKFYIHRSEETGRITFKVLYLLF